MIAGLARRAVRWSGGRRVEGAAVERGPMIAFPSGELPTLRTSFAEQEMLAPSTGASDADVLFAPRPSVLVTAFLPMPAVLLGSPAFRAMLMAYFAVVRRGLLRFKRTRVELVARAEGPLGTAVRSATAEDGMGAGANAIAAIASALGEARARGEGASGVRFVDELLRLDDVVARANALADDAAHEIVLHEAP